MALENGIEIMMLLLLLLLVTWPGDRLVENFVKTLPSKSLLRATDTLVHGIIGAISWQLVCLMKPHLHFDVTCLLSHMGFEYKCMSAREKPPFLLLMSTFNMFIAFALASAVDLDHVIKDFIHFIQGHETVPWQRGWFHLVLPPLTLAFLLYISGIVFRSLFCVKLGLLHMVVAVVVPQALSFLKACTMQEVHHTNYHSSMVPPRRSTLETLGEPLLYIESWIPKASSGVEMWVFGPGTPSFQEWFHRRRGAHTRTCCCIW